MSARATLLATINDSALLLSLLYDLGFMPETSPEGSVEEWCMKTVVNHFNDANAEIATLRAQVARVTTWANATEPTPATAAEIGYDAARAWVREIGLANSIAAIDTQISSKSEE